MAWESYTSDLFTLQHGYHAHHSRIFPGSQIDRWTAIRTTTAGYPPWPRKAGTTGGVKQVAEQYWHLFVDRVSAFSDDPDLSRTYPAGLVNRQARGPKYFRVR